MNTSIDNIKITSELSDTEEILFELDECLQNKEDTITQLKDTVTNLENDIKRFTTPYNCETGTLQQDISMFQTVASKYVKKELIDFYIDRMRKAANKRDRDPKQRQSTINALCELISKDDV